MYRDKGLAVISTGLKPPLWQVSFETTFEQPGKLCMVLKELKRTDSILNVEGEMVTTTKPDKQPNTMSLKDSLGDSVDHSLFLLQLLPSLLLCPRHDLTGGLFQTLSKGATDAKTKCGADNIVLSFRYGLNCRLQFNKDYRITRIEVVPAKVSGPWSDREINAWVDFEEIDFDVN